MKRFFPTPRAVFSNPACGFLLAALFICLTAARADAATYTVTNTAEGGAGSLRQAVVDANASVGVDDTIIFAIPTADTNCTAGVCTITLANTAGNDEILVSGTGGALIINGTGADRLTIAGGAGSDRIFYLPTGANLTLSNLKITGGGGAGAGLNSYGGAIFADGASLTLNRVWLFDNDSLSRGGGIYTQNGGSLTVNASTVSDNSAFDDGGGIFYGENGTLTVNNSTFSGNTVTDIAGGAICTFSLTTIRSSTITNNTSRFGGGIWSDRTLNLGNTIVAGNIDAADPNGWAFSPDIYRTGNGVYTTAGYNLISNNENSGIAAGNPTAASDYVGTNAAPIPPQLEPLAFYGGAMPTHRPQAASIAVDKGSLVAGITTIRTDARGVIRPFDNPTITNASGGNGSDIGAFELQTSIVKDWGYNEFGQLGLGNTTNPQTTPQTLTGFNDITAFSGGYQHSIALRSNGTVITAGNDSSGQLGDGTIGGGNRTTFGAVTGAEVVNITAVSSGFQHNLALRSDGTVWAWGRGTEGQLGNGASANSATPVQVGAEITNFNGRVIAVSAGYLFSLALTDNGKVWAWGRNDFAQLGDGTFTNRNLPVPVLSAMGGAQLSGIVQVSAGENHSVALTTTGTVLVWGDNGSGQVGIGTFGGTVSYPTQTSNTSMGTVTAISAGAFHTVALNTLGEVWAWGQGIYGQIGDGNTAPAYTPRKTSTVSNVARLDAHYAYHTLVRQRDGTLFVWGRNNSGQIGNGTTTQQNTPLNISAAAGTGGNLGTNVAVFGAGFWSNFASTAPEAATPAGASVFRGDEFSVTFPASTQAGTTQVKTFDPTATGLTVPANYTILANSTGYDITSTANLAGGTATVCLRASTVRFADMGKMYILHDDDGDGTLDAGSNTRDFQKREICRTTTSFSPFVLAEGPLAPTASEVSISGRVVTPQELGLTNSVVTLTDMQGNTRTILTGKGGRFRFADVEAGETYIISVVSRCYSYAPQIVTVNEDLTDLIFTAQ